MYGYGALECYPNDSPSATLTAANSTVQATLIATGISAAAICNAARLQERNILRANLPRPFERSRRPDWVNAEQ